MSTFNELIDFTRSTTGTYLDSVVYGEELVTNGTFDDGTTGWASGGNGVISVSSGELTITGDGGYNDYAQQVINVTVGKPYLVSFTGRKITSNASGQVRESLAPYGYLIENTFSSTSDESFQQTFVATQSALLVQLAVWSVGGGSIAFDNVSVKEVIGGQVSGTPLLRTAAINEPRLEYDAQGNALGLLIEEGRTNLMTQSNIESAYWGGGSATLTNRNDNALGFFNGTTIASNGVNWHRAVRDVALTENVSYVLTCFYKEGTSGRLRFELRTNSNSSSIIGTIGSLNVTSTAGGALELLSDEAYGDVRKLSAKWTPNYTGTAGIGLGPDSFTSGETVIGYGVQVEEGAFPTSYIPTSGSAVTRAIDSAVATLSDFYYRQKHGSMVVEFTSKYDESTELFKRVCEIGNTNTSDNRILAYVKTDETSLSSQVWDNGVFQFGTNLTSSVPNGTGVYSKVAMAWETNNAHAAFDGDLVGSADTTVSLTQTRDTLGIMRTPTGTGATLTGHIKSIQYYPLRVADAKLETLTS